MAYTRWSNGDLYLFSHAEGYICCMECPLQPADAQGWRGDWESCKGLNRFGEAVTHVREHVQAGHLCDPQTVPRLLEDEREELKLSKTQHKKYCKNGGKKPTKV